ncbi:hypothetical protein [Salinicola aestuarinus]|uniref:hypothetical protein n=1 Tax=Salinicola aestuarinus TaxID=1949082 RepID=UPI000DA1AA88|nr:hypothetical protein [Salinicola aestuarinus]
MSSINGVIPKDGALNEWVGISEEWRMMVNRYARVHEGEENAFDYGERPCLGLWSAAAWRSGFIGLEEFKHVKQREESQHTGRCDLWLCNETSRKNYYVEAKHAVLQPRLMSLVEIIAPLINKAMHDSQSTAGEASDVKNVGLLFLSIRNPSSEKATDRELHDVMARLKEVQSELGCDLMTWTFPSEARGGSEASNTVGVVMLAKVLKNRN